VVETWTCQSLAAYDCGIGFAGDSWSLGDGRPARVTEVGAGWCGSGPVVDFMAVFSIHGAG